MNLLTPEEGQIALRLAHDTLGHVIGKRPKPAIKLTPVFSEKRGVFVTLTESGRLRGCIGFPYPVIPLGDAIVQAATAAALEDPRFNPVRAEELGKITLEVTVLTVPITVEGNPEDRPRSVVVGKHGLIIRGRGTSGLLLPQVATDYGWDAQTFLNQTCIKAGLSEKSWQDPRVELLTFEGQIFSDHPR